MSSTALLRGISAENYCPFPRVECWPTCAPRAAAVSDAGVIGWRACIALRLRADGGRKRAKDSLGHVALERWRAGLALRPPQARAGVSRKQDHDAVSFQRLLQ